MPKKYNIDDLNIHVKLYLLVNFLMREFRQRFTKAFPKLYADAFVHLMFIKHAVGISQFELGELSNTNKSTLSRNIKILLDNELVIKKQQPELMKMNYIYLKKVS
ncbi:hypothetical protein SCLARK_001047 [Spiroplasma clarkii]|uniref:HTH marR-type domain-containing protein n=1 Tax=Spiroplasma clarkii TaxID=2139 RepID=A0A1Y0L0U1_9MOLU|nr:helix-turn-helix domain-containing protein [Spiroplasma clarkii]ARU91627.1 hypothetical protein SCLARK_001047 [Spiroplasma clarkii]ATX71024.1 hypothetical protein SCLAR_v1c07070 [Spiroplasma clarkii]